MKSCRDYFAARKKTICRVFHVIDTVRRTSWIVVNAPGCSRMRGVWSVRPTNRYNELIEASSFCSWWSSHRHVRHICKCFCIAFRILRDESFMSAVAGIFISRNLDRKPMKDIFYFNENASTLCHMRQYAHFPTTAIFRWKRKKEGWSIIIWIK